MKYTFSMLVLPLLGRSFTISPSAHVRSHHVLCVAREPESSPSRRNLIFGTLVPSVSTVLLLPCDQALAVERAVGAAEKACREAGNCLEKGDWDAAVGWSWGGKDRCDATDPKCGPNGVLQVDVPTGASIPTVPTRVTHQVDLVVTIGKGEVGTLRLGLYGEATPQSVHELLDFLSPSGLLTTSRLLLDEGYGAVSQGASILKGGILTGIVPSQRLEFGLPSQAASYARSVGASKAPGNFLPQPRPREQLAFEKSVRPHDCAGLLSIPGGGLGFASSGKEDEAFSNGACICEVLASSQTPYHLFLIKHHSLFSLTRISTENAAFQITASAVPDMDREGRKVIGQLLDEPSMAFLARLAQLPTNKGLKGIIPGQDGGPPLLKVVVTDVQVQVATA